MGCVSSKFEEEEEVVSICRDRKRQLKLAVERRYALAEAHFRYCQALYALGAALKLFVARHSSPSSRFLITFPPPCSFPPPPSDNVISNPMFLQQKPSESTKETLPCESSDGSLTSTHSPEEAPREEQLQEQEQEEEEKAEEAIKREEQAYGYFYMQMPPPMPSPQRDFGWDFFNPFSGVRPGVINGYNQCFHEDLTAVREQEYNQCLDEDLRAVREQEGIPDLEEEGDRREEEWEEVIVEETPLKHREEGNVEIVSTVDGANAMHEEKKGLTVVNIPVKGRELLEALKDIEEQFNRACDSGRDVSRMLEVNRVHLQSGFEEIKGG